MAQNARQAIDKIQVSFLKDNLVGRVAFRFTSVAMHLSVQGEGGNPRILATNRFTEKTAHDQIQDIECGSHCIADVRNAGIRTGGYPGAGCIRILLPQQ
jgi:hypothetical protein